MEEWICGECAEYCGYCDNYVYVDSVRGLKNLKGDWDYCCCNCINKNELDIYLNGESYIRHSLTLDNIKEWYGVGKCKSDFC